MQQETPLPHSTFEPQQRQHPAKANRCRSAAGLPARMGKPCPPLQPFRLQAATPPVSPHPWGLAALGELRRKAPAPRTKPGGVMNKTSPGESGGGRAGGIGIRRNKGIKRLRGGRRTRRGAQPRGRGGRGAARTPTSTLVPARSWGAARPRPARPLAAQARASAGEAAPPGPSPASPPAARPRRHPGDAHLRSRRSERLPRRGAPPAGAGRGSGWRGRGGAGNRAAPTKCASAAAAAAAAAGRGSASPESRGGPRRGRGGTERGCARPSRRGGGERPRRRSSLRASPAAPAAGSPRGLRRPRGRFPFRSSGVRDRAAPNGRPGRGAGACAAALSHARRGPRSGPSCWAAGSRGGVAFLRRRPVLGSLSRWPPHASSLRSPAGGAKRPHVTFSLGAGGRRRGWQGGRRPF